MSLQYDNKGKRLTPTNRPVLITGKSKTKTSERDACDINKMVARFNLTGVQPRTASAAAKYADVSELVSYQDSLNRIQAADEMFAALSSKIRERFHNNPAELLEFFGDEKNQEEAVTLGLIDAPKPKPALQPAKKPDSSDTDESSPPAKLGDTEKVDPPAA